MFFDGQGPGMDAELPDVVLQEEQFSEERPPDRRAGCERRGCRQQVENPEGAGKSSRIAGCRTGGVHAYPAGTVPGQQQGAWEWRDVGWRFPEMVPEDQHHRDQAQNIEAGDALSYR